MARAAKRAQRQQDRGFLVRIGRGLRRLVIGTDLEEETAAHLQEIKGLALIGVSLWVLLSMATYYAIDEGALSQGSASRPGFNFGGRAGNYLATWVFLGLGWSGYCLPFLGVAWGLVLVARKRVSWPALRVLGAACTLVTLALWLELALGGVRAPDRELPYGVGGWLAAEIVPTLIDQFGGPGLWILLSLSVLIAFMLATQMAFYSAVVAFAAWIRERRTRDGERPARALWGWLRGFCSGLWRFLSGADIEREDVLVPLAPPEKAAKALPAVLDAEPDEAPVAPRGKKRAAKAADLDEAAELEDEELDEEESEDEESDEDEDEDEDEEESEDEDEDASDELDLEPDEVDDDAEVPARAPVRARHLPKPAVIEPPTPPPGPWRFPPLDLLEPASAGDSESDAVIELAARKLEHALASFRVEAVVVKAQVGPAVTLFELEVTQGTRLNKVTQLSQEIAAALRAKSVRIIAPIPGKSTIGIEVPNTNRRLVRLSELITQHAYDKQFAALPLFLGMDAEGNAVIEDLSRMPHLLIAGTTGSGKSVCINTILASLLLTRSPHDVQMILIDPKMVELQMFATVPHLMLPVVNDMRHATNVLLWAVEKMEGRYELFKDCGVRNVKGYNALSEDELRERMGKLWSEERTPRHISHIVIVIDEMADLMMTSKKEAELAITRLAQKSRAVGIHVIVATQRPSTDVITGVLKGNLPTRIAFKVASKVDSRVILDVMGAEKLLGSGDMLYSPPQTSQLRRVQGALVEDHEIQAIVDFVSQESAPNFSQELVQAATGTSAAGASEGSPSEQDDLFDEAVRIILKTKRGSASLLQRALGIGYTRASRLIDLMTAEGIVGEHKGSKSREILLTLDDWEAMHGTPTGQGASDE